MARTCLPLERLTGRITEHAIEHVILLQAAQSRALLPTWFKCVVSAAILIEKTTYFVPTVWPIVVIVVFGLIANHRQLSSWILARTEGQTSIVLAVLKRHLVVATMALTWTSQQLLTLLRSDNVLRWVALVLLKQLKRTLSILVVFLLNCAHKRVNRVFLKAIDSIVKDYRFRLVESTLLTKSWLVIISAH